MAMSAGARAPALGPSARWSVLWGLGMALVFIGERVVGAGAGASRGAATLAGLGLVVAAMVARARRAVRADPERALAERLLLRLYGLGLLAVALYFVQSDLPTLRGGMPLEHSSPKLATVLAAVWPAIWIAATWPIALIEMSYAQMAKAPRLEMGRLRDALFSGLGVAFAVVFVFTVVYVSSERDHKFDLAYFRTTRPGEVVRKIVRTLDQPMEIASFFPGGNEVREEVDEYLADLAKESGQLKVTHYDFDIDPIKAKELGVSTNGTLVFVRGHRHELLGLP
ncbi:MAG TPA: ABC transporter, partial [Polyangia bacterium]|nr:ABC transporter [Polyangia bacterium]